MDAPDAARADAAPNVILPGYDQYPRRWPYTEPDAVKEFRLGEDALAQRMKGALRLHHATRAPICSRFALR